MKLISYIAPTKRLTRARQEYLMREHDIFRAFDKDDLEGAIKQIRSGRALVVAQASVLGRRADDIEKAVMAVHARGGYVIEAATGRTSEDLETFLMGLNAGRRKDLTAAKARKMATRYDKHDENLTMAREMWGEQEYTIDDIVAETKIPRSTLIRRLGKRKIARGPRAKR